MDLLESDISIAIDEVVSRLTGIESLFDGQLTLLQHLIRGENVFYTSPTDSGKTIPPVILPDVLKQLNTLGM